MSVLGFFAVTGNHGWYIMPMFVPCALLVGQTVSAARDRQPVALGALTIGTLSGLWVTGLTATTGALVFGIAVAVGLFPLTTFVRDAVGAERYRDLQTTATARGLVVVVAVLLAGVPVLLLVGGTPAPVDGPTYSGEEKLGVRLNEVVPAGETVLVGPKVKDRFVASFHARRPFRSATRTELETVSTRLRSRLAVRTADTTEVWSRCSESSTISVQNRHDRQMTTRHPPTKMFVN